MWSGPRNISTALMRAWGNRPDTHVCDEPLYAHYLASTDLEHPGRAEVLASQERDWRKVVAELTGPVPGGKTIFYQKHMAHHLLPSIDRGWLDELTHAFLIRDPREMLLSLARVIAEPTLRDTGLPQQLEILQRVRTRTGRTPPIVDARDVLEDPARMLRLLCHGLGVEFLSSMLCWPPGPRSTDGVWAKHWYHNVERSTGFEPYRPREQELPGRLSALHRECLGYYRELARRRLGARADREPRV